MSDTATTPERLASIKRLLELDDCHLKPGLREHFSALIAVAEENAVLRAELATWKAENDKLLADYREDVGKYTKLAHNNAFKIADLETENNRLKAEVEKYAAALKRHCQCRFDSDGQYEECHLHQCQRSVCENGDPTDVTLEAEVTRLHKRVAELETGLRGADNALAACIDIIEAVVHEDAAPAVAVRMRERIAKLTGTP